MSCPFSKTCVMVLPLSACSSSCGRLRRSTVKDVPLCPLQNTCTPSPCTVSVWAAGTVAVMVALWVSLAQTGRQKPHSSANAQSSPASFFTGVTSLVGNRKGYGARVIARVGGVPISLRNMNGQCGAVTCRCIGGRGKLSIAVQNFIRKGFVGICGVFQCAAGGKHNLNGLVGVKLGFG